MYYDRTLYRKLEEKRESGKAIVLLGPRQVGKTTLLKKFLADIYTEDGFLFLDGDDLTVRQILGQPKTELIRRIIGSSNCIFIDEAQRIPDIGLSLKIIVDQFPDVSLYVSGSSALELQNRTSESLTGRKWGFTLLPISYEEYEIAHGVLNAFQQLENRLLFGMYPEVLNSTGQEKDVLRELVSSYLYKDFLAYADIRKSDKLEKLVQALAVQIGSEVNYSELAKLLGIDKNTVGNYIDILEKGFIVFRLPGFSRNVRNEIKKGVKIYFYDNGIRNMAIGNFLEIDNRNDKGALWENFLISERYKQHLYCNSYAKMYFWRTTQQQEIDLIEEKDGMLKAFEFKWKNKNARFSKTFLNAYNAETHVVDLDNFGSFLRMEE